MKRALWIAALALLLAVLPLTTFAQEDITLEPVTLDTFGVNSLAPAGWSMASPGIFTRGQSAADFTLLAQQSAPLRAEALLQAILPQLGLTAAPEPVGEVTTEFLTWTLYQVDVETPAAGTVRVDVALAQGEGTSYVLLVQSAPDEYDALHEQVFLPVLQAYTPIVEPVAEVPYASELVTFPGGAEDVTLAGTLTLPEGDGPHPAIVLVTGSGPQDRDETLGTMKPFALLADALTHAGVAVLRYDDRGVGVSTGDFASATTTDFTADAAAALAYLATREDIDPAQIGVLGHSEGGLVAAALGAQQIPAFIISLAGPGVSGADVLLQQNRRLIQAEGGTQEEIDAQIAILERLFPLVLEGNLDEIEQAVREIALESYATLDPATREQYGTAERFADLSVQAAMAQLGQPWFAEFLASDPAADWAQTTVPVLALFGTLDVQVDADQNAPAVEAALAEAGNTNAAVVVLDGANHLFQAAQTGGVSEYATLPPEFTPDLIPTILDWLAAR